MNSRSHRAADRRARRLSQYQVWQCRRPPVTTPDGDAGLHGWEGHLCRRHGNDGPGLDEGLADELDKGSADGMGLEEGPGVGTDEGAGLAEVLLELKAP